MALLGFALAFIHLYSLYIVSFNFKRSVGLDEQLVFTSVDIVMQTLLVVKVCRDTMFRLSMVTENSLKKV